MNPFPTRKPNRLPEYDYSLPGCYFVTFCTENRMCLLSEIHEGYETAQVVLSFYGQATKEAIERIASCYRGVRVDKYVIMPNHVHLLLVVEGAEESDKKLTVSRIVQQTKGVISKKIGKKIWHIHFHEHVIRGEQDYREIWEYIDQNPQKWVLDRYYSE